MANGDTKTEAMLNILGNGGDASSYRGCCNTKTQSYILDAIDRVQSVENEVEEIKNNPDVVDIVDTYADLQAYDTSTLTDKDIVRVLSDSTHSGNSTYYRFTKNPDTWTFIGEISGSGSSTIKLLTDNDLNWDSSGSEGDPDSIALWLLEDGYYAVDPVSYPYVLANSDDRDPIDPGAIISIFDLFGDGSAKGIDVIAFWSEYSSYRSYQVQTSDGTTISTNVVWLSEIQNAIQAANYNLQMGYPIPSSTTYGILGGLYSCGQNQKLYMCTAIDNTDPDNPVYTWTEVGAGGSGSTVVQTTGTSTTDVMSQNATSSMVFDDPSAKTRIKIGSGSTSNGNGTIAIGTSSYTNSVNGIAIGGIAAAQQNNSVALGYDARTTRAGEVNVGLYSNSTGYNNTHYRVIGGVHDPVDAHDAATKGYVDAQSGGGGFHVLSAADINWEDADGGGTNNAIALWLLPSGNYYLPTTETMNTPVYAMATEEGSGDDGISITDYRNYDILIAVNGDAVFINIRGADPYVTFSSDVDSILKSIFVDKRTGVGQMLFW